MEHEPQEWLNAEVHGKHLELVHADAEDLAPQQIVDEALPSGNMQPSRIVAPFAIAHAAANWPTSAPPPREFPRGKKNRGQTSRMQRLPAEFGLET